MLDAHSEAAAEEADDESRQKSRDDRAFPEAFYPAQAEPSEQSRQYDQRYVVDDLKITERQFESVGKSQNKTFTGNDHGVAGDFQHDAEGHDGAARKCHGYSEGPYFGNERVSYPHAEVDEYAENEYARQLQKLSGPERFSEQGNLSEQHERIHAERARAHGNAENFGNYIGNTGYGGRTQLSVGDHGYAVAHEKQTEKENDPALAAFFGNGSIHLLCH